MNIVFIHGIAGSKRNFTLLQKHFPDSLAFDLIGYGQEKKPNVTYDSALFIRFLEKKIPKKKEITLVGHSLGAILAKEYALKHKVKKVILINYPFRKEKVKTHWFYSHYIKQSPMAKLMCQSKHLWKYPLFPFFFIFYHKYFNSFVDYFKHTYRSASSSIRDTILKDDNRSLEKLKNKCIIISGDKDCLLDQKETAKYKHYLIKDMGHNFFGHEEEIAEIINAS
ncbi:hypothetical protein COV20_03450 [Candidatus Woesearchaeota archaeon CG10_big_fil_rev_8_21_14_0_10_45_16]|nr:MAG: hypothetical protein COV20_03450 [Candidatus Woesearchaeota archaeon CG10_big_fil_rev_8_21_14_0_10_45_16]